LNKTTEEINEKEIVMETTTTMKKRRTIKSSKMNSQGMESHPTRKQKSKKLVTKSEREKELLTTANIHQTPLLQQNNNSTPNGVFINAAKQFSHEETTNEAFGSSFWATCSFMLIIIYFSYFLFFQS
jgi:hypothetical protein